HLSPPHPHLHSFPTRRSSDLCLLLITASMRQIHIGTSGWAYPSWKPDFYPAKTPSSKLLDYYSTQLNCVEVNYTFRARPAVTTRSEEHTSELQSQSNLVCRLL